MKLAHHFFCLCVALILAAACHLHAAPAHAQPPLIANAHFLPGKADAKSPEGFSLDGDVRYGDLSEWLPRESSGRGVRFLSGADINGDKQFAGSVHATVTNIAPDNGRWYRLQIRAMAEDDFHVEKEDLFLKVEFFKGGGRTSLDHIKKTIYAQVELERTALKDAGTNRNLGGATWRYYALDFKTPFPEVDTLVLSAGFDHGKARGKRADFAINQFELIRIDAPASAKPRASSTPSSAQPAPKIEDLVSLGGRWYFHPDPKADSRTLPDQFDHTSAHQLLYQSDRLIAPFAGNLDSWLRKGYLDLAGKQVAEDKYIADNVIIRVTKDHLVIRSYNLPNHPTAVFPDRARSLDGNPNYIAQQNNTWYLPLVPKENPNRVAMKDENNNDHALPMGPIGVAVNGVVFFNPFDHLLDADAVWRIDRCCGHPSPNAMYHYHKYPVCVKSPWTDDGESHSPVIGFAFDGYPVYGPYEAKGQLARESKSNPLNEFNVHEDKERGLHYHVTPGKFPHILGGFWGQPDPKNQRNRPPNGPPPGKAGGPPKKG